MKKSCLLLLCLVFLVGCMPKQNYIIPTPKVRGDFLVDREFCEESSGYRGGGWIFGPVIIILPIVLIWWAVKRSEQKDFQKCMESMGYQCQDGCYNLSMEHVSG